MNKKKGSILIMGGLLLLAAALFLTCYNLWEEHRAEASASAALEQILPELSEAEEPAPPPEDSIPDGLLQMPTVEADGQVYIGVLSIPALGLELPVISQWSYPHLEIAPCRFEGSAYLGDLIIAAHNYRSHFGGLKNLRPGDEVAFTDVEGNVFRYTVAELETLDGNDLEGLEGGEWDLTLFTCTLARTTRVVVRCAQESGNGL